MSDDFFAELEAEIASATAKSKLRQDAAQLKRQALNTRLSAATRARAASEFKAVQAIIEANAWIAVRSGALFSEQHCDGCGSTHYTFLQFMQEEQSVRNAGSRRWIRVPVPAHELPRETIIQPLTTHICSDCCEDHGFDVTMPSIKLLKADGALTVSATYDQGDINGTPLED